MILTLPGDPVACPRPRHGASGHSFMPSGYMRWKSASKLLIRSIAREQGWVLDTENPCRISVVAIFERPASRPSRVDKDDWKSGRRIKRWSTPDADNIFKAIADACQEAGIVLNDSVVELGGVLRFYAASGEKPHMQITIEEVQS